MGEITALIRKIIHTQNHEKERIIQILCDFLDEQPTQIREDLKIYLDNYTTTRYNLSMEDEESLIGSD